MSASIETNANILVASTSTEAVAAAVAPEVAVPATDGAEPAVTAEVGTPSAIGAEQSAPVVVAETVPATCAAPPTNFYDHADYVTGFIQRAVDAEGRAFSATEASNAALYGMIDQLYGFIRMYRTSDELRSMVEAAGISFEPKPNTSEYTPIVQALICPKTKGLVRMDEKALPRWRTKVSKICGALHLAGHLGRTDIAVLLTEDQDGHGTGLDAVCARWARMNKKENKNEDNSEFDKALAALVVKAGTALPSRAEVVNTTALVAVHYAEDGSMRVLGPVNGEPAEDLLKSFVLDSVGTLPPKTQIEELLGLVAFAKVAGGEKLLLKIIVTGDGTEMWASQRSAASCIAHLRLHRPSLLPHGTYWLDQKMVSKLRGFAELRHYEAEYRVDPPVVVKDTTSFRVTILGRMAAEKAYSEVPKNGAFDWRNRLPNVGERPAKDDDVVTATFGVTGPKSVRLRNEGGWMQRGELPVDARIEQWITKTLGTGKGDSKRVAIAQAVNAGENGDRMTCAISPSAWALLDDRDATVAKQVFEAPIVGDDFEEIYTLHSKDLPSAHRAIKTILPEGNIKIGVFAKMLRLTGEHEGSFAEFLLPSYSRSGSRCSDFAELFDELAEHNTAEAAA